jgi:hypothetical protein
LRLTKPAPGVAVLGAGDCGPHGVLVSVGLFFYGDDVAAVAEREGSRWQEWLAKQLPAPPAATTDETLAAAH